MTSETPCPPGCREWPTYPSNGIGWANSDGVSVTHAPNCPIAKPAEPPACRICGKAPAWNGGDWCRDCSRGKGELQSEPPIDHRFEAMYAAWKAEQAISIALRAEMDALKAEVENVRQYARIEITDLRAVRGGLEMRLQTELAKNAALKAELDHLKQGIPLTYNPNTMCRDGHEMVLFTSDFEPCPMCALKARMEELSESLLWATSSYEERVVILANREKRKEQENTNAR